MVQRGKYNGIKAMPRYTRPPSAAAPAGGGRFTSANRPGPVALWVVRHTYIAMRAVDVVGLCLQGLTVQGSPPAATKRAGRAVRLVPQPPGPHGGNLIIAAEGARQRYAAGICGVAGAGRARRNGHSDSDGADGAVGVSLVTPGWG